jgi:hypothetical protein
VSSKDFIDRAIAQSTGNGRIDLIGGQT